MRYLFLHFIVLALASTLLMRFRKSNFVIHILVLYSLLLTTTGSKPVVLDKTTTVKAPTPVSETIKDSGPILVTISKCDEPTVTNDEGTWGFDRVAYVDR